MSNVCQLFVTRPRFGTTDHRGIEPVVAELPMRGVEI